MHDDTANFCYVCNAVDMQVKWCVLLVIDCVSYSDRDIQSDIIGV
jgi:hypothetical protein